MSTPDRVADPVVRDRLHLVARGPAAARAVTSAAPATTPAAPAVTPAPPAEPAVTPAPPAEPAVTPAPPAVTLAPPARPAGDPGGPGPREAPRSRRERRAARPSAPAAAASGPSPEQTVRWLPLRPPPADAPEPASPAEVVDVVTRRRAEALATAAAGYAATHGHPLDHDADGDGPPAGVRWRLLSRHAVVAGAAVLLLTAGVVVRAWSVMPAPPVALDAAASVTAGPPVAGAPPTGTSAAPGSPAGMPAAPAPIGGAPAAHAPTGGGPAAAAPTGGATTAAPPVVVVHVVGRVAAPGVLTLPAGARVTDAVTAAGGPAPEADLTAVNLARPLVDGEQIHVPAPGEPPPGPAPAAVTPRAAGPGASGGAAGPVPVPLNTADLATLDALPGIGPVLAARIVDWRSRNGPFRSVDELAEVAGIGDALLARLRPMVRV